MDSKERKQRLFNALQKVREAQEELEPTRISFETTQREDEVRMVVNP